MRSEIEEQAERLKNKLHHWAKTFDVPISEIDEHADNWLEYLAHSDELGFAKFIEFQNAQVAAHTPENPILIHLHLYTAAMALLCFQKTNRQDAPKWVQLILAAENLSLLEGYVGAVVFEREARTLKLSKGGKKGAQAKHQRTTELKKWAVAQAQGVRGSDMDISRILVHQLPAELVDASKSPERAIYDAIRAARQTKT